MVAIIIPIIIFFVVIVFILFLKKCLAKHRQSGVRPRATATSSGATPAEAILAAAAAAGGGSALPTSATNANGTTAATTGAPRGRRTRRTPSQISTKSLPAYMENPGDEEMVLVRRHIDMQEQEQIEEEGDENPSRSSIDISRSGNEYGHENHRSSMDVDVSTPFMQTTFNPSHDMPTNSQSSGRRGLSVTEIPVRQSFETIGSGDTHGSMESDSGLLGGQSASHLPVGGDDERGEAPPYFESVEPNSVTASLSNLPESHAPSAYPQTNTNTPTSQARRNNRISSSIRNLFGNPTRNQTPVNGTDLESHPESSALATSEVSSSRPRADTTTSTSNVSHSSSLSLPSLLLSRSRSPSGSRPGGFGASLHRPSTSTSTASHFTHHHNRSGSSSLNVSNTNMSTISLNTISAPLAHTATRTDFTFPKAGPNAKQLAFVSSREKLGSFGVPFGIDARAAARDVPPPFPTDATPAASSSRGSRLAPATWWQKLTNPAGSSSPPKSPELDLPAESSGDDDHDLSGLPPLPPSRSGTITSVARGGGPSRSGTISSMAGLPPLPPSRAGTISSVRSSSTYATAVDNARGEHGEGIEEEDDNSDNDEDYSLPTPTAHSPTRSESPSPPPPAVHVPTMRVRKATIIVIPEPEHNNSSTLSPPRVDLIPATPITPITMESSA